ncbi:hypothetical protein [Mycobacterium colombiense]|uniref:hypothetical protein n=1 Tax=Mycobacterium colombiense TaxID=339268 RepID=UPI0015BB8543|nr:hypothetical protein [Mycobacterium colombiense]
MSDGDAPGDVNSRWPRRDGSAFDASARPVRPGWPPKAPRGSAQPANEKRGEKLEIFDEALARVGERLGAIE